MSDYVDIGDRGLLVDGAEVITSGRVLQNIASASIEGALTVGGLAEVSTMRAYASVSPAIQLQNAVTGKGSSRGFRAGLSSNGTDVAFWNYENGFFRFGNNNSEVFRITDRMLVGVTTNGNSGPGGLRVGGAVQHDSLTVLGGEVETPWTFSLIAEAETETEIFSDRPLATNTAEVWEIWGTSSNTLRWWFTVIAARAGGSPITFGIVENFVHSSYTGSTVTGDSPGNVYSLSMDNAAGGVATRVRLLRRVRA